MDQILPWEALKDFCKQLFQSYGFTLEESGQITDVLLTADLFGIESHGISRILKYVKLLEQGSIDSRTKPELLESTAVSALYDARGGMGQLAAIKSMAECVQKAKAQGIAVVTVRNSNHYGIAGYYALMAAREGLIGISMTNSVAILVPTFSAKALLGSNPIAFAMPMGEKEDPFLFDAATTVVTRGKLELYQKLGKTLPEAWAVNDQGKVSYQPDEVLSCIGEKRGGGILPVGGPGEAMAGYKGYGFAMICEILTSVLAGGKSSLHKTDMGDTSHCFIALDYGLFGDKRAIEERMRQLAEEIRSAPKAAGETQIFLPGEKEFEQARVRKKQGIPVSKQTLADLQSLSKAHNLPELLYT